MRHGNDASGSLLNPALRGAVPIALLVLLASPRPGARAEDSLSYKYSDYSESGGRIGVQTQAVNASQALGSDMQFGLSVVNDAISGASPTGLPAPAGSSQVPLAHLSDHRKDWEADLTRQFRRISVSGGLSESREHDYVSRGWSLNTLTDFNAKNTTLLAGVAAHDDDVETFYDPQHLYVAKHAFSAILGVTQLLDPLTTVTLNASFGRDTGYLSDQYKLVERDVEIVPGTTLPLVFAENRPHERNSGVLYASIDRAFPGAKGSLEGSARAYRDTYGILANTLELRWLQKLGESFTAAPELRFYEQDAAKFYYYDIDATDIIPTFTPNPAGPAYSSDYRLSSLFTTTYGMKVTWKPRDWLHLDLAFDRYAMRGRDGVTPQSAYPRANIVTAGAGVFW